jgi:hypothetical protein
MSPLAYSALTAVIFTSAAGALVMCLLVFKYGFAPSADELPSASVRRLFITRLGHALAGTCFAATAILAAVTLADLARVAAPPAAASAAPAAGDPRATEAKLEALSSRMSAAELLLQRADDRVRKIEAGRPAVSADVRRSSPSDEQAALPRVMAPPPSVAAAPRVVSPAPPPSVVAAPRVVSPAPPPSVVAAPRVVPPAVPKPARPAVQPSAPPDDLGSRLARDWEAVKRGFATAGSEFLSAIDEQGRSMRGD